MNAADPRFSRRDSFRMLGVAATAAALAPAARAAEAPKLKGRIKQSCTRGMLRKMPTDAACRICKELGLVGLDLVGQKDWPALKEHGLVATMAPGAGSIKKGLNDKTRHADYLDQFRKNIAAAAEYGWRNVITMAGDRAGISDEEGMANCVPVPKPTCSRGARVTSIRHLGSPAAGLPPAARAARCTMLRVRSASRPAISSRSAGRRQSRSPGADIMAPTPPNCRAPGRLTDSMPKWSRLGAATWTARMVMNPLSKPAERTRRGT